MSCALYDKLKGKSKRLLEKNDCATINSLSQEHLEMIYVLILHHSMILKSKSSEIPFSGKIMGKGRGGEGKGIIYKVNDLPNDLQQIISGYLDEISK